MNNKESQGRLQELLESETISKWKGLSNPYYDSSGLFFSFFFVLEAINNKNSKSCEQNKNL